MTKQEALTKHRTMWNYIADMIEAGERHDHAYKYKTEAWKKWKKSISLIVFAMVFAIVVLMHMMIALSVR